MRQYHNQYAALLLTDDTLGRQAAFSVGLSASGDVGPFDSDTTVLYDRELTDRGGDYNPSTGRW